jgi:hypothetical protein
MQKKQKKVTLDNAYSSYEYTAKTDSSEPALKKIWYKVNSKLLALFKSAQNAVMKLGDR